MTLTDAIQQGVRRATRITGHEAYIVAEVHLHPMPSGYTQRVEYRAEDYPMGNTVGIVHTDGEFKLLRAAK